MAPPERKRTRLRGYDYSRNGLYFVTICTADRVERFGQIRDGQMALNEICRIITERWQWLADQYPYVHLDAFVIMPNHVHGIACTDSPYQVVTAVEPCWCVQNNVIERNPSIGTPRIPVAKIVP